MTLYETPGNRGILSRKQYLFVCGGCYTNFELEADNLDEAKARVRRYGWENGFRARLGAMSGARGTPSTWRCDECVAKSRRWPLVYFPKAYEWRRVRPPAHPDGV